MPPTAFACSRRTARARPDAFVLADVLELNRDLYYGLYAATVIGYVGAWVALTGRRSVVSSRGGWGWPLPSASSRAPSSS